MSTSRYPRNFLILGRLGRTTARNYATVTDLPRPPVVEESRVETFSGPSKPRLYYTRPPHQSDLPRIQVHALLPILRAYFTESIIQKRWPFILAFATVGVSAWAAFLLFATNQEKLSSSVVKQILQMVGENEELKDMLGDAIRPEAAWYLNGDPWIHGSVRSTIIFTAFIPFHYFVLLD